MLEDEDLNLFRQEVEGIKPLAQDVFAISSRQKRCSQQNIQRREAREKEDTLFFFSDEYEPLLNEEGAVKYLRENEDSYILKQLRRGDFPPDLFLDLHGLTKQEAKMELAALIHVCQKERLFCASIMTGHGSYTLKRQIPRWLVQHPQVIALHQAPKQWGGDAAILVLFDQ
ncbi:endonuclease SmrB [Seminibacterium arietis]|uniref:Ribosome rescue factor SmrB n=1 Tax=Seminibacterium arietis TaxID=1173502 RepID=A0ABW3I7Q1_9PAST